LDLFDKDLLSIQEVRALFEKAKKAQKVFAEFSQEKIDEIVKDVAYSCLEHSARLAELAVKETGFGRYEDKIIKNTFASKIVYESIKNMKTIGIINEIKEKKIIEIGMPVGIVAALVPSTNPTSTTIFKSLISIKSGNAVIFSPHPAAINCITETVTLINSVLAKHNVPEGLISCMSIPTLEGTEELMKLASFVVATGGASMVKAAYKSGTPALGVGPGNVPAFIERSADISLAVKRIIESKVFDNGVICSSEQAIITEKCIENEVKAEIEKQGGYFVYGNDLKKLGNLIQKGDGSLNTQIVGQIPEKIASMAGISIPKGTKVLVCEQDGVGKNYPFSREKLSPILAFYTVENWEKACERSIELLNYGGLGHSLSIHSYNEEIIMKFALKKPASRILINTGSTYGAIGATTNLFPSLTLGCGAIGGSATSDNVSPMHLINIKRVAYGVREVEEIANEKKDERWDVDTIVKLVLKKLSEN